MSQPFKGIGEWYSQAKKKPPKVIARALTPLAKNKARLARNRKQI